MHPVILQTWLTRRPQPQGQILVTLAYAFLAFVSVAAWRMEIVDGLAASGQSVFQQGQIWRLFTATLVHADLGHLLGNSLLFLVLGYFLAAYFGGWVFPLAAFFFGALANALAVWTYPPQTLLLGASGVVSWMGGAWLTFYLLLNRQKTLGQRWLRAIGVGLMLFAPAETLDPAASISHRTHAFGFFLGAAFGGVYFWWNRPILRAAEVIAWVDDEPEPAFNTELLDGDEIP